MEERRGEEQEPRVDSAARPGRRRAVGGPFPRAGAARLVSDTIEIFTDGACKGNPGPGGWGVILRSGAHVKELHGGEWSTTNNRMELTAVIKGLGALTRRCKVKLWTDSQYVQKG